MKKLFDEIPFIEGERLVLRRLTDEDIPALKKMTGNKRVYRCVPTFLFEIQYDDMHEMITDLYSECFRKKETLILGVYLKESGEFCGLAEFYGFKDSIHKVCVGNRLAEEYWGRGISAEVAGMMADYLLTQTDIEIITASTMVVNPAAGGSLEKSGFTRTASSVPEDWGFDEPVLVDKWFR